MKTGQIIFGISVAAVVGATIYFGFIRKYADGLTWYDRVTKGGSGAEGMNNFEAVAKNLGINPIGDIVRAEFNNNKNAAVFYKNNRVAIGIIGGAGIAKGTYSNGGLTIKLDTGKEITSNSVWQNLAKTIV